MNMHTLYAVGVHGTRVWSIWSEGNVIHMFANGANFTETVKEGLAGRTIEQQVELRVNARVRNKLDHGFVYDEKDLSDSPVNQLGTYLPMLAERYDKQKYVDFTDMWGQPKLDGHRCLANNEIVYTRRGKEINTVPEIFNQLKLPYGISTDGELYCHGQHLQTIASWAKRRQKDTDRLQYWTYDLIIEDDKNLSFEERFKILREIIESCNVDERIVIVPTRKIISPKETISSFISLRHKGYEGLILRPSGGKYEIGKRSKKLLKVKHYEDEEFEIINVHLSRQSELPVFDLKTKEGKLFKATVHGDRSHKFYVYKNKERYIGKLVTCEFANYTIEKIPFQPVAIRFKEDI